MRELFHWRGSKYQYIAQPGMLSAGASFSRRRAYRLLRLRPNKVSLHDIGLHDILASACSSRRHVLVQTHHHLIRIPTLVGNATSSSANLGKSRQVSKNIEHGSVIRSWRSTGLMHYSVYFSLYIEHAGHGRTPSFVARQ